jgi:uncharacterized protein (TIGR02300 family)
LTVAKPELGTKRLCASCGAKFYDLNKSPIICPKCQTVYEVAPPPRSRSDRGAAAAVQEEAPEAAEVETVSLEEADSEDNSGKVKTSTPESEDDIEADETIDDDDDDSTFIADDEEEGEDDVSDIVGDRDSDEET